MAILLLILLNEQARVLFPPQVGVTRDNLDKPSNHTALSEGINTKA